MNLPGGIYYIYLAAYDADGNWRDIKGKTNVPEYDETVITAWPSFEIDRAPPVVIFEGQGSSSKGQEERHFSPNGDGRKDTTMLNYCVTDESYRRVNYLRQNEVEN